jgi:hypothetical protein
MVNIISGIHREWPLVNEEDDVHENGGEGEM